MQYPHKLLIETLPVLETNEQGYQVAVGEAEWEEISVCRDEPNSSSRQTTNKDGIAISFSSLIQTPKSVNVIEVGTKVRVMQGEWMRLEGGVKRFDKGSFHCRIWV